MRHPLTYPVNLNIVHQVQYKKNASGVNSFHIDQDLA